MCLWKGCAAPPSVFSSVGGDRKNVVRISEELQKPDGQRLREYTGNLPALKQALFSRADPSGTRKSKKLTFTFGKLREDSSR
jgi:hypothetical protein